MAPRKREQLLDTAETLFYEEGFHATGIDRVIAMAGVARMTLYNHFPSKEALIEAVLTRRYRRYLDDLKHAVANRGEATAVAALARRHGAWLESSSPNGCIVLQAIAEFEHHHPPIANLGRQFKRELVGVIATALAADGQAADTVSAERILVVLEGANALVPVLGPKAATAHLDVLLPAVLTPTQHPVGEPT